MKCLYLVEIYERGVITPHEMSYPGSIPQFPNPQGGGRVLINADFFRICGSDWSQDHQVLLIYLEPITDLGGGELEEILEDMYANGWSGVDLYDQDRKPVRLVGSLRGESDA